MVRPADQTTARAERTEEVQAEAAARVAGILWVFPGAEHRWTPVADGVSIGRSDECGVQLDGTELSRCHAAFEVSGEFRIIADLDSTNGTFVNGEKVRRAALAGGDVLRIGEWIGIAGPESWADWSFSEMAPHLLGGPEMAELLGSARRGAASDLPALIEGETGTGKERVARVLHEWSGRQGEFVAVNCAALPEGLAEAELFGHAKGAFTGAFRASVGYIRSAHEGTLLLDELGDLPLPLQAKLLRALEESEVTPVGQSVPVAVDVRVLGASQHALRQRVEAGAFRADLFARLNGFEVRIPPLRERRADIPFLFAKFLDEAAGGTVPPIDPELVEALLLYDWPMNVRELASLARRLVTLHAHEGAIRRRHLPDDIRPRASEPPAEPPTPTGPKLKRRERRERDLERVLEALKSNGGNLSQAASAAGVSRQRAYRLIEQYSDIRLDDLRSGEFEGEPS